jgi:4-amino-4-deoxy-L-arabinose transferase-like glycosyltransferase
LFSSTRLAIILLIALSIVYFYGLSRTGMLGPDEPRYAAIGKEMAHSGDLVTPRLWGSLWFEKPPLIYWTTALATKLGLGPEVAPRLPVALLGFGFIVFFYFVLRGQFGPTEALYATAVLGTSAGWLAYSYVAVTDIPLAVLFGAAWLLSLEWVRGNPGSPGRAIVTGALLGLAVLAKGLVPLVLFAPFVWPMRHKLPHLFVIGLACIAVAAPWYALCTIRNGSAFFDEFIMRHHFQRYASDALQHVRPVGFYVPVILGAAFPWTPLFSLIRPGLFRDPCLRFSGWWLVFAFVFFSAAKNKLPGYIIPMLPALALVLGLSLGWARKTRIPLFLSALLLVVAPIVVAVLPEALQVGLSRAPIRGLDVPWVVVFLTLSAVPLWLEIRSSRTEALASVALIAAVAFLYVKVAALPATDRVRPFYREHANWLEPVCLQDVDRDHRYGLQYYAGREFPDCGDSRGPKILGLGNRMILLD